MVAGEVPYGGRMHNLYVDVVLSALYILSLSHSDLLHTGPTPEQHQQTDCIQGVPGGMCQTLGECSLC
jgi:hypothetical protein